MNQKQPVSVMPIAEIYYFREYQIPWLKVQIEKIETTERKRSLTTFRDSGELSLSAMSKMKSRLERLILII